MSKLKISALLTLSVICAAIALIALSGHTLSASQPAMASHNHTTSPRDLAWGKANAPVLIQVEEVVKTKTTVELKGIIKSEFNTLQMEWKIPEGAIVLSGEQNKTITISADTHIFSDTIKIDLSAAADTPIVLTVFVNKSGERIGNSRVYKWNKTPEEVEHTEKIKLKMKFRKAKLMR